MSGTKKADIEQFLREFKRIWDNKVIDRLNKKNVDTLTILGITSNHRANEIRKLKIEDYYKGPSPDRDPKRPGDIWEFGKRVKKKEIYIKIKLYKNKKGKVKAKCFSFHIAEWPIHYPHK